MKAVLDPWYPSPALAIQKALEQYGGWSRLFGQSALERDKKNLIYSDKEMGFWFEWAKVKADEQLRQDVEVGCREFRKVHGNRIPLAKLRVKMARALLQSGWKPRKAEILTEMRALRKQKREDILCLRKSLKRSKGLRPKRKPGQRWSPTLES